jgi:hypothetical protein
MSDIQNTHNTDSALNPRFKNTFNIFNRISSTKIYDTRKRNNYEEYDNIATANIPIPFDVIEKITKYIKMDDDNTIKYNSLITYIESLNEFRTPYKIYKEDIMNLRVITVKSDEVVKFDLWN